MPIPSLTTDRLLLRPMGPEDAEASYAMYSDPEVTAFLDWDAPSWPEYLDLYAAALEKRKRYPAGLGVPGGFERETGRMVGVFMLKPLDEGPEIEVGYHLARWAWGKGYATEGARALLKYGRETLGLSRIVAVVRPDNVRSLRVVERLGLRPDGEVDVDGVHCLRFRT
jgi:RimJ/RimL family protein N-acetyltransferase